MAGERPSATSTACAQDSLFRSTAPGRIPSAAHSRTPGKSGTSSQMTSMSTRLAAAMAAKWPMRANPVTSVQAWAPASIISSAARLFSAAMDRAAASALPSGERPIWAAKPRIPVPSALVRTRQSPTRAAALVMMRRGSISPVTAKPALISRSRMLCPPITATPASAILSIPPRRIWRISSSGRERAGKPITESAVMGRPPMAYTSLNELAAAIWPNV